MKITLLLTWLYVAWSSIGLSVSADSPSRPSYATLRSGEAPSLRSTSAHRSPASPDEGGNATAEHGASSGTLPLETQYAVSAALGKDQTAYHFIPRFAGVASMTQASPPGSADQASPECYAQARALHPGETGEHPASPDGLCRASTDYQAANPNQHFNARFDAQGACVVSGGTHWNLRVQAWGYGDALPAELKNTIVPAPFVSANRVEYHRGALTEWYVNGPLGLQQGFTVHAPPARLRQPCSAIALRDGESAIRPWRDFARPAPRQERHDTNCGPLTFVLNLPAGDIHSQVDADQAGLTLLTYSSIGGKREPALRYSGLTALDADGARLPAWLETRENKLLVRVDDKGARYPITIDPFIQQAKLTATAWDGAANDLFGICVALSSNGNTAIVGAHFADVGGNTDQGAAYIFTRSGAAWSQQARLIAADGAAHDRFSYFVALSGNGDTAIAGADGADVGTNANQGAAYIFTRSGAVWTQQAKLTAADGAANDNFGICVAVSGDGNTAIAGADGADVGGNAGQGAAYIFTGSGSSWSQQAKLTAADGAASDRFGICVVLNSDGNTAISGADHADVGGNAGQGAAYIFTRSGAVWTQQAKLTAADGATSDGFGWSVALNSDGDTAIAGAYFTDVGGNADQGAAYIFTRSGASWSQQAKLTAADGAASAGFGNSVTLSSDGNTAFANAYSADVGGNTDQGAAYVFTHSNAVWTQQAKLTAADGAANDQLGIAVALSSDGNTAFAGAGDADVGGNNNQGAAYVFTRSGASWSQQAKLIAADGAAGDTLGIAVALSSDGNTAIAGAYLADVGGNNNQGVAYVFTRSGLAWSQQAKLIAADGATNDYFGYSVALSSDGNTAIAGAYGANADQGAAYVFTRSGAVWTQQEKLTAADGAASDYFGYSVALSSDGDTAIAGAHFADVSGTADQGAAYIFTRSGASWSQQAKLIAADGATSDVFGVAVALSSDGDTAIAGANRADVGGNINQGAAYVFTRSGVVWTQQEKLTAADGAMSDLFGIAVALSSDGDTAIAGAAWADVGGNTDQGAAYVFTRSGAVWAQQAKIASADGAAADFFGISITLSGDGNTAIAGAYLADVGGNINQGAAYVFTRSGAVWTQQEKLIAADGAASDYFGYSAALSSDGSTVIVGAQGADVGGNAAQGAAYVLALPPAPTGVDASYDFYIDRVRVTWDAAAGATGYEVWRGASNDTDLATNIGTGISETNYDDMAATAGTPYYYWVKTTNAGGASVFSTSAVGRVLLGPDVRLNGSAGPVIVAVGSQLVATVSMNPAQYAGYPADWWMVSSTPVGLYYLNSALAWTAASDFSALQPVYQGGLLSLQSAVVLDTTALPAGIYTFYFGVDTLNGVLDPDVVYDSATVTIAP
ncbi:MAG: hypothetical protein HYV35_06290 [Lentisphaerae bacterium]|nr:hypothetical protein [Lentisphaerota bacterium]